MTGPTGPVLPVPTSNVIQIMRNVTGRTDKNDPAFTDAIMIDYLNGFVQQEHPQEVRIYQNHTWWDFPISPSTENPMPVDLDQLGFSTINKPAYIAYTTGQLTSFQLFWYEDPVKFYSRWPWQQIFTPQMPTDVLYWNNELTFRGPPDQLYNVRISAYRIDYSFAGGTQTNSGSILAQVPSAYLNRYFAYGASLNILSDYRETDVYNEVFQVYRRYRGQVLARTWQQLETQRILPEF
jgi:hypothetical protein